jgi:hypothetical protein
MTSDPRSLSVWGKLGAAWGLAGVSLLLGTAIFRLATQALAALQMELAPHAWLALVANLIFMGVFEGYRGFQKGFSPLVAARALHLANQPRTLWLLLAPLFCMGYFHATRRRLITSYALTTGIVTLVMLVRLLPQPWRGIVDAGVVLGLSWGLVALWIFSVRAFGSAAFTYSPQVPGAPESASDPQKSNGDT